MRPLAMDELFASFESARRPGRPVSWDQDSSRRAWRFKSPTQCVLFASCGVLYDDTAWKRWLFQLVGRFGLRSNYASFFRAWQHDYDRQRAEQGDWPALRDYLHSVGLSAAQLDELEAAVKPKLREFDSSLHTWPGVARTLAKLAARKLHLAITSPASAEGLAAELDKLQLSESFHSRHAGLADVGQSRFRFTTILGQIGYQPQAAVFVGSDSTDLAAAHQAGLVTIAFNPAADASADFYLEQFDQLLMLLPVPQPPLLAAG